MKHYYKVTTGPIYDILTVVLLQLQAARDAQIAWKNKHRLPITGIVYKSVWFEAGFTPDKKAWKKALKGAYEPRAATAEGRALHQELNSLPEAPGWFEVVMRFSEAYGKDVMMVNAKGGIGFARVKDEPAFYMHCDPYWLPEDLSGVVEVTGAEYEARVKQ